MSDQNDALEWTQAVEKFQEKSQPRELLTLPSSSQDDDDISETKVGIPSQYALYRNGYTTTTATVEKIPPGCYDITVDSSDMIYAAKTLPLSGILLELPEMRSDTVIQTVENFWNSEKDYKEGNEFVIGGAAFKSGIMIYGPPGSGKSCTIKLVSKKLVEKGGTVFYASCHPILVMKWLEDFSIVEPNRKCIVILEDIDSLIQNYGESKYLEMLDSAKTINNVLFIATTNYPDRLDPRIYNRPGRFSHVIKIGLPTDNARQAYLKAILKNHRDVEQIVANTKNFTIDHLTALINAVYREKKELLPEIERLKTLFKVPKADDNQPTMGIGSRD